MMSGEKASQMHGRLKSVILKTSQEAWHLDLPEIPARAALDANGQSEAGHIESPYQ